MARDHPELLLNYARLRASQHAYWQDTLANDHKPGVRGIWIIGPPGVGKTHSVISAEPSLYRKAQNKWWDGYVGQPAVLIDDFDETGASLHHYLKLWADRWAHTGRSKGAMSPSVTTGCT